MVARKAPEWLPPGYTEKIKVKNGRKIKYYCNVATGQEFYSKKDVISCAKTEEIFHGTPQQRSNEENMSPNDKNDLTSVEENESAEWLPNGWVMEERRRKGSSSGASTYKVYINPADERKFYSKIAVVRYLKTMEQSSTIPEQVKHDCLGESSLIPDVSQQCKLITGSGCTPNENEEGNDEHSLNMVAIQSTSVDGLPPGWTKEIKMGRSGSRTRKYYTDPVSGYIFYSKTDVFRYLETNDIGSCAVRPKKRIVDDQELIKNEIPHDNVGESPLRQDVSEHYELMTKSGCTPEENKVGNKKQSLDMVQVAIQVTSEDGLPPGWTKEIKRRKSGKRMKIYPLYTDPVSGYKFHSKLDALRYLETNDIRSCRTRPIKKQVDDQELIKNDIPAGFDNISNCTVQSFQLDNVHESASNQDVPQEGKLMVTSGCTPKRDKKHEVKQSLKKVTIQSTSADGLPPGWIKEIKTSVSGSKMRKDPYYRDPVSGYVFRSKKDVLRYLETNNIASCLTRPKKRELGNLLTHEIPHENVDELSLKQDASEECKLLMSSGCIMEENEEGYEKDSLIMVATQSPSADELPAGWKTEIKTGKFGNVRKIYINPLTGSKFYSKPAVARYLKSIESSSTTAEQNKSSSPVDEKLSENLETKRQLFVGGKESLDTEKLAASEAKILEENPGNNSSNNAILACENKLKCAATDNWLRPTNEGFEKEVIVMADNVAIDSRATSLLTEQKLPESGVEKQSRKTQSCSRISKKRLSQDLPRRTSKRLAGYKPGMPPNTILSERAEDRNPADTEAIKSSSFPSNVVADGVLQPSAIEPVKEVADHASVGDEILNEIEPSNKTEKLLTEQAIPEEQTHGKAIENQENDNSRLQDSQLFYPFSETWSDPCLEFAFKTLTGEIPLDDNLGFSGFQQQVDVPYNQTNGCSLPPDVPMNFQNEVPPLPSSFQQVDFPYNQTNGFSGSPVVSTIFQNEVPPLPSQFQLHGAVVQSLPNPLFLSPGNSSFPSSSGTNPRQPSTGARNKDFQTR